MTQKEYERTHQWINFFFDLAKASYKLWLLLGEAQSKCHHIAGAPLQPDKQEKFHMLYLAKGALATTAIEGNTLTEEEVQKLLDGELHLPRSKEYLGKEVENIITACNAIVQEMESTPQKSPLTVEEIFRLNQMVLRDLPLKEEIRPGEIRTFSVVAGRYRGAPVKDCLYLLERLCRWLNDPQSFSLGDERYSLAAGILKAIFAHLYLVWIHPFGDGNGRTGRLLEFRFLLEAGVPTPAAHLLSNHYNETREAYYYYLDLSCKKPDGVLDFLQYAFQGFVDQLENQIIALRRDQMVDTWRNYIHSEFKDTQSEKRKKKLLLALLTEESQVPKNRILFLDTELAQLYEGKTMKTLSRDLADLEKRKLILVQDGMIRLEFEQILAWLPVVNRDIILTLPVPNKKRRRKQNDSSHPEEGQGT